MEMVVSFVKSGGIQPKEDKKRKICRHNNKGFCKMKNGCVYYYSDNTCTEFLRKGMCSEPKSVCLFRHPKECKYWLGDTKGCLCGELCKYLHKTENEGKNIKEHEQASDSCDNKPRVIHPKNNPIRNVKDQQNGKENSDDNNVGMKEESTPKDETNHETKGELVELKKKNKTLNEQLEKLKRVLNNMNNELKAKNGKEKTF